MKLSEIVFPVFKLGANKPNLDGEVLYYFHKGSEETVDRLLVVDDKSIDKDTLALRRLYLAGQGTELHKLSIAIFFIGDLLKVSNPKLWFIDSSGKVFQYTKTRMVTLTFKEITKVHRLVSASAVEVEGLPGRYMSLFPPELEEKFAGLLQISARSYILYGFFKEKHKDAKRKI